MSGSAASIGNISTILFSNSPVITNSEFKGNPTWLYSASAVNSGGGANTLTVHNCTFSDFNTSHWGGAIHIWNYNATITNSLFVNNSAGNNGDGNNGDGNNGDGNNGDGNNGDGKGGAIAIFDPNNSGKQVTISNCPFYGNMANPNVTGGSPGGAIANRVESLTITNSIFWNNDNYDIYNYFHSPPGYAPAIISYSNIEGGLTSTNFTNGGNNINTDPFFVNVTGAPSNWDFHL